MQTNLIQTDVVQRQYDEVIAPHYDLDPQSTTGNSLDRAVAQIRKQQLQASEFAPLKVLDIGLGTGRFLEKLARAVEQPMQRFGLDLSQKMIEVARERIPDLVAEVDDAANLDLHFQAESFDLVSTHFVTGFVPVELLAPKIWSKLADDGYWSFIGGTRTGFPVLRKKANARILKWLLGGKTLSVDELVHNPADRAEVVHALEGNGFVIRQCETFTPELIFADLDDFLEFAYWGGWLTPFVEALGLHKVRRTVRTLLNTLAFPVKDHHHIEIVLAQKPGAKGCASH